MELKELKARAYDLIAIKERAELELRQINQKIVELQTRPEPAKEEGKK